MAISNKLTRLSQTKLDIKNAIEDKGQEIGDIPFSQYADKIANIETGHNWVLATDNDFEGTSNGSFRYIGTDKHIVMPLIIKGVPVTSYASMFYTDSGKLVEKVISLNSNVTNMSSMFRDSQATSLDLSNFDTSNVTSMSWMFYNSQVTTLDLSSFDTSNVTDMSYMFFDSLATTLDLSSFNTSNVTSMDSMFAANRATTGYARTQADADRFNASDGKPAGLNFVVHPDLIPYATDDDFSGTTDGDFKYIGTATTVKIPHIIKGVPVTSYASMSDTDSGKLVEKVISFNPNVTDMSSMFRDSQATTLDLSSFNTSNVTNMSFMFDSSQATTLDLSSFDTSKVTDMSNMFDSSQASTLDLSSFNTSNVTNMNSMFYSSKATTLDLSSFDTSNVTDMSYMFHNSQATTLDLSSFDTSNVTDMFDMFYNSQATTGYARTQADADRFNASSDKPAGLNFVVK